jgi:hypothetical protein
LHTAQVATVICHMARHYRQPSTEMNISKKCYSHN